MVDVGETSHSRVKVGTAERADARRDIESTEALAAMSTGSVSSQGLAGAKGLVTRSALEGAGLNDVLVIWRNKGVETTNMSFPSGWMSQDEGLPVLPVQSRVAQRVKFGCQVRREGLAVLQDR